MFQQALSLVPLFLIHLQEEENRFPWWLILLLLAIIILILVWALSRNAAHTETPPAEHGHSEHDAHAAPAQAAAPSVELPQVEQLRVEPVVVTPAIEVPGIETPSVEVPGVEMPEVELPSVPAVAVPVIPDDLQIIEGIGPKIAGVFKEAGIATFAQLAATPVERLSEILKAANLRLGDPTTWPEQARLAGAGDLEGLKKLQDSLKGGRKV